MLNYRNDNKRNEFFKKANLRALDIAKNFCSDNDMAQEIAQLTTIKLYFWKDRLKHPDKWLYQVTRNTAMQLLKQQNRTIKINRELENYARSEKLPEIVEFPELEKLIQVLPDQFMNSESKAIAIDYFCCATSKEDIAEKYHIEETKLYDRLYHLRQELILYLKFTGDFQYIYNISGTRLNRNILNFTDKLLNCIKNKDYSEIRNYTENLQHFNIFNNVPEIEKFRKYEIKKSADGKFKLVVFYDCCLKHAFVIYMTVKFDSWKKIASVSEPSLPGKMYKIDPEKLKDYKDFLSKRKKDGQFYYSNKEIDKILKESEAIEVIENKES